MNMHSADVQTYVNHDIVTILNNAAECQEAYQVSCHGAYNIDFVVQHRFC